VAVACAYSHSLYWLFFDAVLVELISLSAVCHMAKT
jgi:hypothetical protein